MTIGPDFNVKLGGATGLFNPLMAFHLSHQDHRASQAFAWLRILATV